jgi:hypothetical protein
MGNRCQCCTEKHSVKDEMVPVHRNVYCMLQTEQFHCTEKHSVINRAKKGTHYACYEWLLGAATLSFK